MSSLVGCSKSQMKMKILVLFAFVVAAYGAAIENCHMDRLTACGDPLADFRKKMGQSFPTTEEQVKELCDNMKKAYECADEFKSKCMTPMQIETVTFLTEGSGNVYNDFCTEGSQIRTDYLKHAQCLDDASKTEEAKEQYAYVEAALEDLDNKPPEKKLSTACCGYQWLVDKSHKMGKEKCGEEAVKSFDAVVEMAVSSLPSVFCSGFAPDSAQCNDVLPPAGTKPKGNLKNSHIAQSFASIYLPDIQQ